ncbi:hypothetical protein [Actinacidiphila oryziradicis]|uniref:Uncharacterized protein n=1 Tax=Actinacidiphila oryziradicis TaxID=2571141 RepID=A0A4V5N3C5_9ACTN|nr:hypothetical protein [Actinacidiphila oryziradicis]MCW2874511.1 hypothetical protein [Actinacidiphila oryziradicis]TKA13459.1 hypothetical protein FCI23_01845 [Actinacidiphila oryziradicis]
MPRPTPAQLVYGSATVVLSTLAMLLLSEVRSGAGVVIIAAAGLLLGVLVAVSVTIPLTARPKSRTSATSVSPPAAPGPMPPPRARPRVREHSLRR